MRQVIMSALFQNREEAGYQLSQALSEYRNTNSTVVGVPHGGVSVASVIAEALSLPLEVMPCRKIKHPADPKKSIGSVSESEVYVHDCSHTIPQDYVYHQIVLLRNGMSAERKKYYGPEKPQSLRYRTVILVDDILSTSDTILACLRDIRKQNPLKVVVAVPIVGAEAARVVSTEADDLKFIKMEPALASPHEYFAAYPRVNDEEVKALLHSCRKNLRLYE
ncbi:MAG TPA: phosphoribosyltransferase family protein [Chryseosolibacter sp.]